MTARTSLKIQASREGKSPVSDLIVGLIRPSRIRRRQSAEIDVIDIGVYQTPAWIVHDVDHVHAKFKLLSLVQPDALYQVHIKVDVSRPFDPLTTQGADCAGSGISKDDVAICIHERSVAKGISERLQFGYAAAEWICDLG